jgi:hypothetical protein
MRACAPRSPIVTGEESDFVSVPLLCEVKTDL